MRAKEFLGVEKSRQRRPGSRPPRGHEPVERYKHISPSGVETNMDPNDDDYAINYGKNGLVAKFRQDQGLDVRTGSKRIKEQGVAEGLNEFAPDGFNGGDDSNDLQLYLNVAKKLNMKKYKPSTAHNLIAKKMAELVDVVDDDKVDYARHMARKAQGLPNMLEQGVAEGALREFRDDDDSGGGDEGFPGRGSWKLNTGHYDTALEFFSLFGPTEYQDRWIKDSKTGEVAWEGWQQDETDRDAPGRSIPGELRKMAGFRWDNADESPEDDAPGTGWYYSWSPDWKDIYRQGRDPKGGVSESLQAGEYHVATVTLDDGTKHEVKIRSDEGFREPIERHFKKQGRQVTDIDIDWSVRSDLGEGKSSRKLCLSTKPDSELGASQLSSCKSQGLRARDTDKKFTINKKRQKVKGKKVKGGNYGGPLPVWKGND